MKVPEHCLERLRAARLLVSAPYGPNHTAYPDGVAVGKPTAVPGNSTGKSRGLFGSVEVDGPCPRLYYAGATWVVTVDEYIPGPGPGDFVNEWASAEDAVADILEYFFGDPSRMQAFSVVRT